MESATLKVPVVAGTALGEMPKMATHANRQSTRALNMQFRRCYKRSDGASGGHDWVVPPQTHGSFLLPGLSQLKAHKPTEKIEVLSVIANTFTVVGEGWLGIKNVLRIQCKRRST